MPLCFFTLKKPPFVSSGNKKKTFSLFILGLLQQLVNLVIENLWKFSFFCGLRVDFAFSIWRF